MNQSHSFKAIFPYIAKIFMGVIVYWEISSLINVFLKIPLSEEMLKDWKICSEKKTCTDPNFAKPD